MNTISPKWRTALENNLTRHAHLPFANFVQIATVRADGRPANRTLTFRFFLSGDRLLFTADARTEKISQLKANPWAEACWYFTESRVQFRLTGKMAIATNPDSDELVQAQSRTWQERTEASRQSFTWPAAGESIAPRENFMLPCPSQAPATFALLVFTPERIEHLDLGLAPHERRIHWREESGWLDAQINP